MLEQQDFCNLLRYFGTNWPAIAATMKTKTHIMVVFHLLDKVINILIDFPDQELLQSKDPGR